MSPPAIPVLVAEAHERATHAIAMCKAIGTELAELVVAVGMPLNTRPVGTSPESLTGQVIALSQAVQLLHRQTLLQEARDRALLDAVAELADAVREVAVLHPTTAGPGHRVHGLDRVITGQALRERVAAAEAGVLATLRQAVEAVAKRRGGIPQ